MQKAVALLSGGFDSPVAIHLMQDRLEIVAVHFHQVPLTNTKSIEKVKELAGILQIRKVYIVPFVEVFKTLSEQCHHNYYFILSKIAMLRAAEKIALQEGAAYLLTGENLAQVSSQTLRNIITITKNISMEILRPLLTYNKQEIIDEAKKIGTYEASKGPEICDLLGPKHPATRSEAHSVQEELEKVNIDLMIEESLKKAEVFRR